MPRLIVPGGRTSKQPFTAACFNPECRESSDQERFEFTTENEPVTCPKCGANEQPMVMPLVLTHFLHRNPQGRIKGMGGLRYSVACDSNRAILATPTNQEAASGDIRVVNCPGCIKAAVEKKLMDTNGYALMAE